MSNVSEAELHELIIMSADQIDSSFEFWLTIGFGVLIAVHALGTNFTRQLKFIICFLYCMASLLVTL